MNAEAQLSAAERQDQILHWIARDRRVSVGEISQAFLISEATARRDLEYLSSRGLVQRIHGGAIAVKRATPESPLLERGRDQALEKQRIGRAAAELVLEGETVFLGSGTTVLEVARNLRDREKLGVITNSLPVINIFSDRPHISVVDMGGMLRTTELSFIGHITEQALAQIRVDKVVIGIRGLSLEHGLMNDYLPETLTDRAILKLGGHVIIVADHTKCGTVSTAFVADLTAVHTVVTDETSDQEFVAALSGMGIRVIRA